MALSFEQAYNLAKSDSRVTGPMAKARGLSNLANILREGINNRRKQKGDYSKEMQKILDNDGALSSADKENARELVSGPNYDQFVNGNSDEQKKALDKLKNHDWDIFYLYTDHMRPWEDIEDNFLVMPRYTYCTLAYVLNKKSINK